MNGSVRFRKGKDLKLLVVKQPYTLGKEQPDRCGFPQWVYLTRPFWWENPERPQVVLLNSLYIGVEVQTQITNPQRTTFMQAFFFFFFFFVVFIITIILLLLLLITYCSISYYSLCLITISCSLFLISYFIYSYRALFLQQISFKLH